MSKLVTLASKVTNLNQLEQLHTHLIKKSLHRHNYWLSLLITTCCRVQAPPLYVRLIFDPTARPDVQVLPSLLRHYSRSGAHSQVLSLFKQVHQQSCKVITSDASVYTLVIKSAGEAGILFHSHVVKLGHGNDPYTRNVVLDVYAKRGPVDVARKMFDEMSERNLADWNSMISWYWKWGNGDEACRLFGVMPYKNVISWTAMVSGFAKMKDLISARRCFDEMPVRSVVSWNAILSGYAQNGLAEEALSLFGEMMKAGFQPNETTWVTVISCCSLCGDPQLCNLLMKMLGERKVVLNSFVKTALLDMNAKCGSLDTARQIFDGFGINMNSVTWNAMISAYTRVGRLDSAKELFDKMPDRNVVSWNTMIVGYAQNGHSAMAIELFKEMIDTARLVPDEVTMVSVISACGHLGSLGLGSWVAGLVSRYRIELTISVYNALIFMYSRCGSMQDALRIFQEMETRDIVSYNTMIAGFASHGQGGQAIELLSMMEGKGIDPDRVTYIGVLKACSHAGSYEEGQKIFRSIRCPSIDHYACMVDLLGRAGELDEAKRLIDSMPVEPHAGVYGSLLHASQIYKRIDLGEIAANKLFELEPQNSGNYVLLSNIYASVGRWKDVDKVRELMRTVEVRKTTGWSLIECKGKVHKFTAGDRSHEQSEDIYKKLVEVQSKMRRLGYLADKSCVLRDVDEEEKDEMVGAHSEKLAVCFALISGEEGSVIRVMKNLRVCCDCHMAMKLISRLAGRQIILRDNDRFHHFNDGLCSCKDFW